MRSIIETYGHEFRRYRGLGEAALAQVEDGHLHRVLGGERGQSLAILIQHVGGNLRSRFTDFLAADGEKPWRDRPGEFADTGRSRAELLQRWAAGWQAVESALAELDDADLARRVLVRGEAITVADAVLRALGHAAYHVGEIVLLVRLHVGERWRPLLSHWRSSAPGR